MTTTPNPEDAGSTTAGESGARRASVRDCLCLGLGPEVAKLLSNLGPGEPARQHFRNARIEMLKAVRSMIDDRIATLSKQPAKGTRVTVE
jgi:hypothetical protein